MITLRNDFHNTEARVSPRAGRLSAAQVRRVRSKLCPSHADFCKCGSAAGQRGRQRYWIEVHPDGSGVVCDW